MNLVKVVVSSHVSVEIVRYRDIPKEQITDDNFSSDYDIKFLTDRQNYI